MEYFNQERLEKLETINVYTPNNLYKFLIIRLNMCMLVKTFHRFIATLCLVAFAIILFFNLFINIDKPDAYIAIKYIRIYALPLIIALSLPRLLSKVRLDSFVVSYIYQLIVGSVIILAFPWNLVHDPASMHKAAQFLSNANIEAFIENSSYYFRMYPYQFFYTLLITFFLKLSSSYGMVLLKFFQLFLLILSTRYGYKIIQLIKPDDYKALISFSIILVIWFVPLIYTTYIYGTSLGMSFSVISIYHFIYFLKTNKKKAFVFSCLFILLAICFKLNFSIVLIAFVIVIFFSRNTVKTKLITIGLLITTYWLSNHLGPMLYQIIIGQPIGKGVPIITYFVMGGLPFDSMPKEVSSIAGEWNGYTTKMDQLTNNNSALMSQISSNHLVEQVKHIFANPWLSMQFYKDKLIYTWTMKDYATLDMLQSFNAAKNSYPALPLLSNSLFINGYIYLCNTVQFIILISLIKACIDTYKSNNPMYLLFLIIFIGFLIYHFISESKALYVMPVAYLMLPLVSVAYASVTFPGLSQSKHHYFIMLMIYIAALIFNINQYTTVWDDDTIQGNYSFTQINPNHNVSFNFNADTNMIYDHLIVTITSDIFKEIPLHYDLFLNNQFFGSGDTVTTNNLAIIPIKGDITSKTVLTVQLTNPNEYPIYIQLSDAFGKYSCSLIDGKSLHYILFKGIKGIQRYGIEYYNYLPVY